MWLFAQNDAGGGIGGALVLLIELAILVAIIAGMWKMYAKAGKPGWAAIIPIYNVIVLLEICGRPIWWILLFLIPCVNFVIAIIVWIDVAKSFGKGTGFGLGLAFLGFISVPLLGFGSDKYIGPAAGQ